MTDSKFNLCLILFAYNKQVIQGCSNETTYFLKNSISSSFLEYHPNFCFIFQVLHQDIESHSQLIKTVKDQCAQLAEQHRKKYKHRQQNSAISHKRISILLSVGKIIEKRWHCLWLRSLEWQCFLEQFTSCSLVRILFCVSINSLETWSQCCQLSWKKLIWRNYAHIDEKKKQTIYESHFHNLAKKWKVK